MAPPPLRILLVNDDGWDAPGIVAVRDALRRAGHRVVEVAPVGDRDDTGTGVTLSGDLQVGRPTPDRDIWAISGTASDAVLVGTRAVLVREWPHLVISGINPEPSLGLRALRSGTVGAALTAAGRFPTIAVSTGGADRTPPEPADFARAAGFTVRLVSALQHRRAADSPLLPPHTVLNVNYPSGPTTPRGVVAAPISDAPDLSVYYQRGQQPGSAVAVTRETAPKPDSDAAAFAAGDVVLTDLSASPDRSTAPPRTAARLAPTLEP